MYPKWGDGELFYKERDAMMVVPIDTRSELQPGVAEKLFGADDTGIQVYDEYSPIDHVYDVTADGQRFVMIESLEKAGSNLIVVENWSEQFRRE